WRVHVTHPLLYGCVTWTLHNAHCDLLRTTYHALLRRCLGWHKRNRTDHTLARAGSESIGTTLRKGRLHFAGFVTRISPGRIPKHAMFGEIMAVKGQEGEFDGRHKDWIRCLAEGMKTSGMEWQRWATTRA
ncbi:unnamed protein product, partial [Sphacelaria rigidula]